MDFKVEQKSDLHLVRYLSMPNSSPLFVLSSPFVVNDWMVPVGFETDLASIPRIVRSFISKMDGIEAAVIHDFLYTITWDKEEADYVFGEMLRGAVPFWRRRLMVRAVKSFGGAEAYPDYWKDDDDF